MKKYHILSVTLLLFLNSNAQTESRNYVFYKVTSIVQSIDPILKNKIISTYFSADNVLDANGKYDLNSMVTVFYDKSDVQAVHVKGLNAYSKKGIVIYVKGNLVSDMAMKYDLLTETIGETIGQIRDGREEIITSIKVNREGKVLVKNNPNWVEEKNIVGYLNTSNLSIPNKSSISYLYKKFWERWTSCVSTGLSQMTNGQNGVYAQIAGLYCMGFSGYCIGGAAIGCAAHAAIFK